MARWGDPSSFRWLWHAFVRTPELQYWIQRADFSSANYPAVRFKRGLAALKGHDWSKERAYEARRYAEEEETCPPGIGYVQKDNSVLHICPREYGAQCFLLSEDSILELPYANAADQQRLLRLFYKGRHKRLAGLFENYMAEPAWAEFLQGFWIAAKIILAIKAALLLLIAGAVFATDLSSGQPALESLSRILCHVITTEVSRGLAGNIH